jgi:hypothetical protein
MATPTSERGPVWLPTAAWRSTDRQRPGFPEGTVELELTAGRGTTNVERMVFELWAPAPILLAPPESARLGGTEYAIFDGQRWAPWTEVRPRPTGASPPAWALRILWAPLAGVVPATPPRLYAWSLGRPEQLALRAAARPSSAPPPPGGDEDEERRRLARAAEGWTP